MNFTKITLRVMAVLFLLFLPYCGVFAANTYNVKEYGAVPGDGISDAAAIQKALNEAKGASQSVTVYIPSGTYYINKSLKIYSNTYLKLDSGTKIIRMNECLNKNMLHAVDANGKMDQIGRYDMCKNITVDGGIWDGGNVEKSTGGTDLMRFDHGMNITVKNCSFRNVYDCHQLEFVGIKNGQIINCDFRNFYYNKKHVNQVEYGREAIQLDSAWTSNPGNLADEESHWARGTILDGTHDENILVQGCSFVNYPCCVGQHHYSTTSLCTNTKNVVIKNNTIKAAAKYTYFKTAITCGGMDDVIISGNTVIGPYQYAVNVNHAKGISITGNTFKNMVHNGITVSNASVTAMKKNKISNIKKNGISIVNAVVGMNSKSNTGVVGNTLVSCKNNGISVSGKTNVSVISKNKISKSGRHGISISGGSISFVTKNKIFSSKNNGISFTKGKVYAIKNNKIKKAKIGIYIAKSKKLKKKLSGNKFSGCKRKNRKK